MGITINSRILLSVAAIAAAAALIVGATFAFFSDSETSQDNVFAAGELDLQVDYDCYYNKLADGVPNCPFQPNSWGLTDLGPVHKFFNFDDVKPGDFGEGTISLHVFDNDAWGRLVINDVQDLDNGCGGEEESVDTDCLTVNDGELRENLLFSIWLDEGLDPGFQCPDDSAPCLDDPDEGDNQLDLTDQGGEPILVSEGTVDTLGEIHNIWLGLAGAYGIHGCLGDGSEGSDCPGLAQDGRLVGSITYYFGIDWDLPDTVGNEVQTDSLGADMTIEAVQHRNNSGQVF